MDEKHEKQNGHRHHSRAFQCSVVALIISMSCLSPRIMDVIIIFKLGNNRREQQGGDEETRGIKKYLGGFFPFFRSVFMFHYKKYKRLFVE